MVSDRVYGKEKSLNFRYLEVEICENYALACWDELFINFMMLSNEALPHNIQYNSTTILLEVQKSTAGARD